jgi:hypothetical protein
MNRDPACVRVCNSHTTAQFEASFEEENLSVDLLNKTWKITKIFIVTCCTNTQALTLSHCRHARTHAYIHTVLFCV